MQGVQGLAVSHCLATLNLKQRKGFMADKSIQIKIWVQMQCFISQQNPIKFDCLEEGERAIISLRNGCNFFAVVKRRINLCNQFNCLDCTRNDDNKSTIRAHHKKFNIQGAHFYTPTENMLAVSLSLIFIFQSCTYQNQLSFVFNNRILERMVVFVTS